MKNILLSLGLLAVVTPSWAATENYNIDTSHSQVGFQIRHLFSNVPGRFNQYTGTLEYDAAKPENSKVMVEINTNSINTDNEKRDQHLQAPDFFDAKKYPKMTFKSTSVKMKGKNKLAVTGDLTIRDKTKPVVLDVEMMGFGNDPWGNYRGGFQATTKITRKDFGVVWNQTLEKGGLLLGEDVEINLNVEVLKVVPPKPETTAKTEVPKTETKKK